jgi:hypothetical protein
MNTSPKLRKFRVYLHRIGGRTSGHITVDATCESHAGRVAVRQNIDVSFPNSKPADWIVTSTEELPCC